MRSTGAGAAASAGAAAPSLYVTSSLAFNVPSRLTGFAVGASGNVAPLTDLSGSATGLGGAVDLARDPQGLLWVPNIFASTPSLTAYAATATGNAVPAASLAGPSTGLATPAALAFDRSGRLFVANTATPSITEYAPGARGRLWVTNSGSSNTVAEFAPGATENAPRPAPPATHPRPVRDDGRRQSCGRLADTGRGQRGDARGGDSKHADRTVQAGGSTGDHPRSLGRTGSNTTWAYRFSTASGNPGGTPFIYAANASAVNISGAATGTPAILGFPSGARGNLAPTVNISGSLTGLKQPQGVAVDGAGDIVTPDTDGGSHVEMT